MADSFSGSESFRLQPGDSNVPLVFRFKPATASTLNNGAIPYNSTLKSITKCFTKFAEGGTSSTGMIKTKSLSSNNVQVYFQYTTTLSAGLHYLTMKLRIDVGTTTAEKQFDFKRIYMKEV